MTANATITPDMRMEWARVAVFAWYRSAPKHPDGWTKRAISNPSWVQAVHSLADQGVLELRRGLTRFDEPGICIRLRLEFDG